jgi:hypothetical protein
MLKRLKSETADLLNPVTETAYLLDSLSTNPNIECGFNRQRLMIESKEIVFNQLK